MISDFLEAIDKGWKGDRVTLRVIGSGALMMQTDYRRGTKDHDVLETRELAGTVKQQLQKLAGENTSLHRRYRLYIDVVPNGLPFLPHAPCWRVASDLNERFTHLHIEVLDVKMSSSASSSASLPTIATTSMP